MNWQLLNPLRWKKTFLMLLLGGFLLIWIVFVDTYSVATRWRLTAERNSLQEKTEQLKRETAELEEKIKALRTDTALLEKIAREEYGMRKPEETVYRIKTEE